MSPRSPLSATLVLALVAGCGTSDDSPIEDARGANTDPRPVDRETGDAATPGPPARTDDATASATEDGREALPPTAADPGRVFRRSDNRPRHDAARLAALGIRRYASQRLVLYTDIEPEVAEALPALVDAAYEAWVEYFGELPPDRERSDFQITGYLMRDAARFEQAGLVPVDLPRFLNGRHRDYEFWMYDQAETYYRRHLLLHEATHCFTTAVPGVRMPIWYLEGLAELFATHELVEGRESRGEGRSHEREPSSLDARPLTLRVLPRDKEHFAGLGRISLIEEAVAEERALSFDEVTRLDAEAFLEPEAYAWVWAAAMFLDGHPRYAERFRMLGQRVVVDAVPFETAFEAAFEAAFAEDVPAIRAEWPAFVAGLETGYDLERAAITFALGRPLDATSATATILADRGWQSSALRVQAGGTYRVTATGRFTVANEPKPWIGEANGISFRYVDGRQIGRLLATVVPPLDAPPDEAHRPFLDVISLGNAARFTPPVDGTLYLRLNDAWSELADNEGRVEVRIEPVENVP